MFIAKHLINRENVWSLIIAYLSTFLTFVWFQKLILIHWYLKNCTQESRVCFTSNFDKGNNNSLIRADSDLLQISQNQWDIHKQDWLLLWWHMASVVDKQKMSTNIDSVESLYIMKERDDYWRLSIRFKNKSRLSFSSRLFNICLIFTKNTLKCSQRYRLNYNV